MTATSMLLRTQLATIPRTFAMLSLQVPMTGGDAGSTQLNVPRSRRLIGRYAFHGRETTATPPHPPAYTKHLVSEAVWRAQTKNVKDVGDASVGIVRLATATFDGQTVHSFVTSRTGTLPRLTGRCRQATGRASSMPTDSASMAAWRYVVPGSVPRTYMQRLQNTSKR